ncbi:MAG: hypothetical protein K0R24_142 [Gammaproteobacteria bacterium]|jgi:hypothetical protein|nr:hypothetical protein [Gammaproteobacteria bacterium]
MMTHTDNKPEPSLSDQEALLTLKNHYTGQAIFDPVIHKKEKLIIECTLILNQLLDLQKNNTEEQTKQFNLILEQIHEIIASIETLNKSTEEGFKKQIQHLNESIKLFNAMIDLNEFNEKISTLTYGRNLFTLMDSLGNFLKGTAILLQAWHSTVTSAVSHVKHIFYPIHAAFVTLNLLINFFIRVVELIKTDHSHAALLKEEAFRQQELEDAKFLLKTSTLFRFLTFTLQLLSVLALAGVITTSLGVVFLAAASLTTWIDETLSEEKTMRDAKKKFQRPEKNPLTQKDNDELNLLNEKISQTRWNAAYKSINVISAIFIACGIIPPAGPILGIIGLSMLSIAPVKVLLSQASASKERSEAAWKVFSAAGVFLIACLPIPTVGPIFALIGITISSIVALKYAYTSPFIQNYFPARKTERVKISKEKFKEKTGEEPEEKPQLQPSSYTTVTTIPPTVEESKQQQEQRSVQTELVESSKEIFEEKKGERSEEKPTQKTSSYATVTAMAPRIQESKQQQQASIEQESGTYKTLFKSPVSNNAKYKDNLSPLKTSEKIKPK